MKRHEMCENQAVALMASNWWTLFPPAAVAQFQLSEERLCMPWAEIRRLTAEGLGQDGDMSDAALADFRELFALQCETRCRQERIPMLELETIKAILATRGVVIP